MGDPLFLVRHKEYGWLHARWPREHLDSHLFISPAGRVFWLQHDGVQDMTDEVEVHWIDEEKGELLSVTRMVEGKIVWERVPEYRAKSAKVKEVER